MNQRTCQSLIRGLAAVVVAAGALLVMHSGSAYTLEASIVGDPHTVCADVSKATPDPEVFLSRKAEDPAEVGYHTPVALSAPRHSFAQPRRTHFPRAPPVS